MFFTHNHKVIKKRRPSLNDQIRAEKVRLVIEGQTPEVVSLEDAIKKAQELEMDLVEVAPGDVPTCKIMDYGKYLYKQKKQEQNQRKGQKQKELKSLRIGVSTDVHDLKVKEDKARKFLETGHPTKIMLLLRGREHVFKDLAAERVQQFVDRLQDVGKLEGEVKRQGSNFIVILSPLK